MIRTQCVNLSIIFMVTETYKHMVFFSDFCCVVDVYLQTCLSYIIELQFSFCTAYRYNSL